jgi:amidase
LVNGLTNELQFQIYGSTAGQEIRRAIDASGEPPTQQMRTWYDNIQAKPSSSAEFWDLCHKRQQYREEYHKYWMGSRERSISKRLVDGVIMPVAPSAAVEEGLFSYYGMSFFQT